MAISHHDEFDMQILVAFIFCVCDQLRAAFGNMRFGKYLHMKGEGADEGVRREKTSKKAAKAVKYVGMHSKTPKNVTIKDTAYIIYIQRETEQPW